MANAKQPYKNSLSIRLAESVIFLRADPSGRNRNLPDAPPAVLRGLLTLTLVKPTKISSIEVELVCKTSTAWPEGVGARRIDITEDHKPYEQSYVFFDASKAGVPQRRTLSVGPGVAFDRHSRGTFGDEEERSEGGSSESFSDLPHPRPLQSSRSPHTGFSRSRWGRGAAPASLAPAQDEEEERRGRGLTRTLPPLALPSGGRRGFGRQLSVDQTNFQSGFVSHHDRQLSTPPYSPEGRRRGESPAGSPVALPLSRMTTVSGVGSMHEVRDGSSGRQQGQDGTTGSGRGQGEEPSPAHSLEEFRRTLRAELGTPSDFVNHPHSAPQLQSADLSSSALLLDTTHYQRMSLDKDAEFVLGNSSGETVPHPGSEGEAPISPTSIASTSTGANHNTTPNPTATFHANGSNNSQHSSNSTSNEEHSQNPTTPTTLRGRSRASKRFSFASVSNAFMGAVKSVRSVSQQGRDLTPPPLYPNPLNGTAGSNTYRDSSPDLRDRGMSMGRGTSRDVARGLSRDVERRYPFSPIRRRTSVDSGATGLPLAPAVSNVTASGVSGGVGVSGVTKSTFGRVTGALGLDTMEGKEYGDGWKEFRTGVYTYPISFAIPTNSSPTINCDYGSVSWRLKAYAHRPGTFKQKLSASEEVLVVTCPGEDDTEETESIIVERQWDDQMQYLIAVSGRCFPIGGSIPISLTFMPWTKMKIFRLAVVIEERIDYLTNFKRVARSDAITRIPLLALQMPGKDTPLLPLAIDDISDFKKSPLWELFAPSSPSPTPNDHDRMNGNVHESQNEDADGVGEENVLDANQVSEIASSFLGPGPWKFQKDFQLPRSCDQLHFTNKNKKSNIIVSHLLKIIFRVQRGDDDDLDPTSGKRKLYDIVVQTPIHILSCLCSADYTSLPPYSGFQTLPTPTCGCERGRKTRRGIASPPYSSSASGSSLIAAFAPLTSPVTSNGTHHLNVPSLSPHRHPHLNRHHSGNSVSTISSGEQLAGGVQIQHGFVQGRPHDSAYDRNAQYERLITGRETEVGEAPPDYDSLAPLGMM